MMKPTREQSTRIQVLRGCAIAAVVLIHNTPPGVWQVWCRPLLNWSVGMFLFLSGMLSSADRHHPGKRLAKVLVPYAAWTLAYVLASNLSELGRVPMAYLKGLLLGNAAPMMYYVFVYCELTLMIPLFDVMARSRWRFAGLAVSPLEVVLFRLFPLVNGIAIAGPLAAAQRLSCLGWFSYFYLGYLLGNGLMEVRVSTKMLAVVGVGSLILQVLEGWWQLSMGVTNCGTQLKLSSLLTGTLVALLAYRYVLSGVGAAPRALRLLGDRSFGIYFSHIAIMSALGRMPWYAECVVYPLNAIVTTLASLAFCSCAHALLGRYGRYVAL